MIEEAIEFARQNPNNKYKLAAIITTKRKKVVSKAWNEYEKTHPLQKQYADNEHACYPHAEVLSIVRAKGKGDTMYLARVTKGRLKPALSRPCPTCLSVIKNESEIKRVVYTIDENEYGVLEINRD